MILLQIIAPKEFKTIPWKNGLGETTELLINDGGNLESFDWRLSIASVVNDGIFSDFSGYQRNLVLISGEGINLEHDENTQDSLSNLLDIASFEGASKTYGNLVNGPIKDFNIITSKQKILPKVSCFVEARKVTVQLTKSDIFFAYSLSAEMTVESNQHEKNIVPQGSLLKTSLKDDLSKKDDHFFKIHGENMILVKLQLKEVENT